MAYRFSHSMYYANAEQFSEQVMELVTGADPSLEWFCLDAVAIDEVDYSAAAKLRFTYGTLKEKRVRLVFGLVSDDVRAELDRFRITDLVGTDACYTTGDDLLNAYHCERLREPAEQLNSLLYTEQVSSPSRPGRRPIRAAGARHLHLAARPRLPGLQQGTGRRQRCPLPLLAELMGRATRSRRLTLSAGLVRHLEQQSRGRHSSG